METIALRQEGPRRALRQDDQLLRSSLPHQLRRRRGDGDRAGVPVRHELERVLPLRRQHLRGPARARSAHGVLPREHLHRVVVVREGPAPGWVRLASIWLVAIGTQISVFWIILANAWMHHPVGYASRTGRRCSQLQRGGLQLSRRGCSPSTSTAARGRSPASSCWRSAPTTCSAARTSTCSPARCGSALVFAAIGTVLSASSGHPAAQAAVDDQPMKFAAMEAQWEDLRVARAVVGHRTRQRAGTAQRRQPGDPLPGLGAGVQQHRGQLPGPELAERGVPADSTVPGTTSRPCCRCTGRSG